VLQVPSVGQRSACFAFNSFSEQALQVPGVIAKFWQPESLDRIIRDRNDLAEKINYTLNNPVKAGLVKTANEW
jgi:hypothetical protein